MKKILWFLIPLFAFANQAVFSLSWQKSFCKTTHKLECRYSNKYDYFTIHGLWPKKQNCKGIRHFRLDKPLYLEVRKYMPSKGLMYHEWQKHGSCYSKKPSKYFQDMIRLTKIINNSKIGEFFKKNQGKQITKQALNRVINKIYPKQANKFSLRCKKGYVVELRMNLNGDMANDDILSLLKSAKRVIGGCQRGKIAK